jgi:ATP-binding cassette subfamily C exporter for protease/lipase
MDEPNASLDEAGERSLMLAIRSLKAAGSTVIFTTHRPELVGVSDFLLILSQGKVAGYGPTAELLASARKRRQEIRQTGAQGEANAFSGPPRKDGTQATFVGEAA